jgi:hypothetical protein
MDPASQALAQNLPPNVRRTYAALAERCDVPVSVTTVWYRDNGRPSRQTKAERQQYLTPSEEKALVVFVLRTAALGSPVRIKDIPPLAFSTVGGPQRTRSSRRTRTGLRHLRSAIQNLVVGETGRWIGIVTTIIYTV